MKAFLEKPLKSIAKKAEKIELMEIKGLTKLKFRERNIFEDHDDHGHKEDDHDDHAKKEDDHDDHDHDKKEKDQHGMTIMTMIIKRKDTMTMDTKDMLTVSLIHTFG